MKQERKKILFYGNCQLSATAKWFAEKHSGQFECLNCQDCGLVPFWKDTAFGNFAAWSPVNGPKQKDFYKCIHSKIEEADVFVFMPHEGESVIPELDTRFLTENLKIKQSICIPDTRLFCYPICNVSTKPYVEHVRKKGIIDREKILDYLINELDPEFDKIFMPFLPYEEQLGGNNTKTNSLQRANISKNYPDSTFIDPYEFIVNNWKTKLLSVTHNHPSFFYYEEIFKQLFNILDEPFDEKKLKDLDYPKADGSNKVPNFLSFNFIKKYIPNIELPPEILLTNSKEDMIKSFKL